MQLLSRVALGFLRCLVLMAAWTDGAIAAERPPNVLFILADDLGWRDLSCYGSTFHQTPNLDKLAARGVRFTQAYAANPLCSPTRSSILTGLWPARTGITSPACHVPQVILEKGLSKGNPKTPVLVAQSLTRLKTEYVTLAEILKEAGYRTGHFGKWHLGADPYSPLQQGFDVDWPHHPGPGPAGSYVAPWKFSPQLGVTGQPGEHIEDTLAEHVASFIRENKDRPFYANYWQFSVHAPYDAKADLVAKHRPRVDAEKPQRNPVYAAMVESLDDGVGTVLAALEEAGVADNTIIVFFSDNGGISWGGPEDPKPQTSARFQADMTAPPTSNTPLRGGKANIFEGGVREPCLVVWPTVTQPGTVCDEVIQSIDWLPTLLEMTGTPMPEAVHPDGESIVPALRGKALKPRPIFCHFPHDTPASGQHPAASVRSGDWKLIRNFAAKPDGGDVLELYDLATDIGEQNNVAREQPAVTRELDQLLSDWLKETEAVIPILNPSYQPNAPAKGSSPEDPLLGWKDRGCNTTLQGGILTVSPREGGFLGVGAASFVGPATLRIHAELERGSRWKVEWFPKKGGPPQTVSVRATNVSWGIEELDLPAAGPLGILRVYPPTTRATQIDWIEIQTEQQDKRWNF